MYSNFARRANVHVAPILPNGPTPVNAVRAVTNENQLVEGAAVSHDGQWLVYGITRADRQNELRVQRSTGGLPVTIAFGEQPVFSDDSRWLASLAGIATAVEAWKAARD